MKPLSTSHAEGQKNNAFLRSCQIESDPQLGQPLSLPELATFMSLQMIELRNHVDGQLDEILRACKDSSRKPTHPVPHETTLQKLCSVEIQNHIDGRWGELLRTCKDAVQQFTVPEETLQQLCKASTETVSELKSLMRQTSNLEQRFMQHLAGQLTRQQSTRSIRQKACSADDSLGETGAEMRLEARLMSMQQSQSARFEEVLQQGHCLHACLKDRIAFLEESIVTVPLVSAASPRQHKHQVKAVFQDPTDFLAQTTPETNHGSARPPPWLCEVDTSTPQVQHVSQAAKQDVSGLMQTLGWSSDFRNDESQDMSTGDNIGVVRCRMYLQWISMVLVVVNALFMGVSAEAGLARAIQKEPYPGWARVGDIIFLLLFVGELLVRLAVDKWKFVYGPDIGWNAIDVVTTFLMGLEAAFSIGGNASFLRATRLLRFMRALRALQIFRSFRIARLMFLSLYNTVQSLACGMSFLFFILYLSSLGVAQFVEQHISEDGVSEDLLELYGSLWATMFTFFMAIMGGADWRQLLRPLHAVSGLLVFAFVFVEVFTIFGVTNLLTAIIVDGVIRDSQTNERLAMSSSMVEQKSAVNELRQVLTALPPGTNGLIERRLAAKVLKGEGKPFFENMGIKLQTAVGMLKMLDTEDIGCVHVDEFLCILSQLQAENMSVHMTTTIYESKKILSSIAALRRVIEEMSYTPPNVSL